MRRIVRAMLYRLSGHLPCRIISEGDRPYLERYYVATLFGVRCYLHRFVASDPDRGLHDHPWAWSLSLILSGWYVEETRSGRRTVRWFNAFGGDHFHRVIIESGAPKEVWTLFFHKAGDCKPWGFLREVPETDGAAAVWQQFKYRGGKSKWWETAPRGDCMGRQAAA
jgi:hypothetical protein